MLSVLRKLVLTPLALVAVALLTTAPTPAADGGTGAGALSLGTRAAAPQGSQPALGTLVPSDAQTAALLSQVEAPSRDLISLTLRLKMKGQGTIPAVVNATPPQYRAGARHTFYVANILGKGYYQVGATLRYVTEHVYWYVKDGFDVNQRYLEASAKEFETRIYPTSRRIFGSEASPGIDNDQRITVLIAPIAGVGGYFSSADSFPRAVNPYSNERDMIYMSIAPEAPAGSPTNYFEGTLAHEFQHMIQWNVNRDRDIWLDEGFSEIASHLNDYEVGGSDFAYVVRPDTQLNTWAEPGESGAHYGASYLFLRYLMQHHGGEELLGTILKQQGLGISAIDAALKGRGYARGFEGAFSGWAVANVLNDPDLEGGRYGYALGGRVSPGRTVRRYPATRSDTVSQYGVDYIALTGNLKAGTVTFKGNRSVRVTGTNAWSGGAYWYSNRRDSGDATLTREVDLTGVKKATLRFRAWYEIENYFDYAYVMASVDGGKSWTPLKGRHTTTENPNGSSFGHGWTGKSGPSKASGRASWVEESADLTPYAGKKVLVRFEYVTDEGLNFPGLAVDDITIPETGFRDDAESDSGWTASGFVRVGNRVPQRWYVALVEQGIPNRVREVVVSANGEGKIDLTPLTSGRTVRDDILVIAPMAPKTTERANYTITVRGK